MKALLAAVLVGSLMAGCATPNPNMTRNLVQSALPAGTVVSLPAPSVSSQAEVGQSMVSTARRMMIPAVKLDGDVEHFGENNGNKFKVILPAGVYVLQGNDMKLAGSFYKAQQQLDLTVLSNGAKAKVDGGVFVPADKTKPTEFYWIAPNSGVPMNQPHAGIVYHEQQHEQWGKDSFKRELVYSGVSQNTVSILYREFLDDMARPAFSQELKYDLSQGKTIGYRGARFEVLKADNMKIEYKVMKSLD